MQGDHDLLSRASSPQPPPARGRGVVASPHAIERYLATATGGLFVLSVLVGDGFVGWAPGLILLEIRLPRTLLAILVGGGLGLSGAVLQGGLRNRLADPGLLGITGAAGLGAVLVFYWGLAARFAPALPLGGLAGAGVGAVFLLSFAGRAPSGPSVILAGIAISAVTAALLALALALAPNPFALAEITFWLLGGLQDRTLLHVGLAAPPILLGAAILVRLGRGLDALSLGADTAASLGVPVGRTLRLAALGTALAAAAAAAVAGGIGFVGLVVPNLLRPIVGERPGALLVPSALGGAALLLAADLLVRLSVFVLPLSAPLPLGVLTALLGAPCLVAIARRTAP
jgi:iron complex transport system permease protein